LETAKEVGLRVEKNDASDRNNKIWRVFRAWLGQSLFTASATHIIRYVLPTDPETQDAKET
jgi:hypothetical protein